MLALGALHNGLNTKLIRNGQKSKKHTRRHHDNAIKTA